MARKVRVIRVIWQSQISVPNSQRVFPTIDRFVVPFVLTKPLRDSLQGACPVSHQKDAHLKQFPEKPEIHPAASLAVQNAADDLVEFEKGPPPLCETPHLCCGIFIDDVLWDVYPHFTKKSGLFLRKIFQDLRFFLCDRNLKTATDSLALTK